MQDIVTMLKQIKRPRLLIRAARIAATEYRRGAHLARVLGEDTQPRPGASLLRLMELEAELNARRKQHDATYSIARHVEVLSAMMGEARLMQPAPALSVSG